MHASRQRQTGFNKRVLQNQDETFAINSGLSEFLTGFSVTALRAAYGVASHPSGAWPSECISFQSEISFHFNGGTLRLR
jgi:hypothetical protein